MSTAPVILHLRSTGEVLGAESVLLEMVSQGDPERYRQVVGVLHDHRDPFPPLARQLNDRGHDARVFTFKQRLDIGVIREIARFMRELPAAIVHCHGYREDLYGYLASRALKPALVATNHNWLRSNRMLRLYASLDGRVLRRFDHVVGVSAPIVEELRAAGVKDERISMISNGVALERFNASPSAAFATSVHEMFAQAPETLLGVVGSLTPEKGHKDLLAALASLVSDFPGLGLLIIGDGPLRAALQQQAETSGLQSHVAFAGTRRDIAELLACLDIFVLPSVREGLPMALLEAMASALPVVATKVGDVATALDHGEAGALIPPGNPAALAEAIRNLINQPDLRRTLGHKARVVAADKYSSKKMAASYMTLYDQLLRKRRG